MRRIPELPRPKRPVQLLRRAEANDAPQAQLDRGGKSAKSTCRLLRSHVPPCARGRFAERMTRLGPRRSPQRCPCHAGARKGWIKAAANGYFLVRYIWRCPYL